ncbi:unnamed protein product [Ilex paraguariensis]|uniref:Uncharacterized protein n=1 Tax=Ilex paraguariensis TaxID=185542 RepID=A0ABC8SJ15_9AQUA
MMNEADELEMSSSREDLGVVLDLEMVPHCGEEGHPTCQLIVHPNLTFFKYLGTNGSFTDGIMVDASSIDREEKTQAFHLLHQTTPYIAFGFTAANEAICQAAQGKDSLHIIDLGIENTFQWPSLLRT